ncbi:MAG: alpha-E domain-containing protein [Oceanococcaceae bacterium]
MNAQLLSRVAEHFYWFGRYIERAENTARLIIANGNLALDLPGRARLDWYTLVETTSAQEAFASSGHNPTEPGVLRFLIADLNNPGSILSSLRYARENLRSMRDRVPREVAESMNVLYAVVSERSDGAIRRTSARFDLLRGVMDHCQIVRGYLAGTMSRGLGYRFIRSGQVLERADMTTRIMDVRVEDLLPDDHELPAVADALQWMAVLRSLSAYQMYRRHKPGAIKARHVIDFLLQDESFPRSVYSALSQFRDHAGQLPQPQDVLGAVDAALGDVSSLRAAVLSADNARLHTTLDQLQVTLLNVHAAMDRSYFDPQPMEMAATQTQKQSG